MPEANSPAVAFTVTELTGQQRVVRLVGRALPYQPFTISGNQNVEIEFYPGNPVGAPTVLGSRKEPTSVNGFWKDRFIARTGILGANNDLTPALLNGTPINDVKELVELFESIMDEGQELEVVWAHIVRRGFLSKFTASWHNVHDVQWDATFDWISDGRQLPPAAFQQSTSSSSTVSQLQQQRDQLVNAVAVPFNLPVLPSFVLALSVLANEVNRSVVQGTNIVNNTAIQATPPEEVARRTTAVCNGVIDQTTRITRTIDASPSRTLLVGTTPTSQVDQMGLVIRMAAYMGNVRRRALVLKRTAIIAAATIGKTLSPGLLATYRARNGEDLRDVSLRFYNTSFEWRRLLAFNILDSSLLVAGQTILVPRISGEVRQ